MTYFQVICSRHGHVYPLGSIVKHHVDFIDRANKLGFVVPSRFGFQGNWILREQVREVDMEVEKERMIRKFGRMYWDMVLPPADDIVKTAMLLETHFMLEHQDACHS